MIKREAGPDNAERQRIADNTAVVLIGGPPEQDDERIHQNALEPAELARGEIHDLAQEQAAARGDQRDDPCHVKRVGADHSASAEAALALAFSIALFRAS
ncbi:hypothetical protein D3C84_1131140 [compost metagenome]